MDLQSSPQKNEQSQTDKKKSNEGQTVIIEQQNAVKLAKKGTLRRFKLETVTMDTLSGNPLVTKMWVTDDEYVKTQKREKEIYRCEFCDKEFDKRQKMLLHSRFHNKN